MTQTAGSSSMNFNPPKAILSEGAKLQADPFAKPNFGSSAKEERRLPFLPKSKFDLLEPQVNDLAPRRTWSLYTLSSASPQLQEPGGPLWYPNFPEQRVRPRQANNQLDDDKQRQAKLLLVALLENFCLLYKDSPQQNRHLFLAICKTLSAMGIVDHEYIDEMSGVRQSYIKAFKDLVVQATMSVEQDRLLRQERRSLSLQCSPTGMLTPEENDVPFNSQSVKPVSFNSFIKNKNLDDLLDLYDSRYRTDFEEKSMLGKGGFGSAWMAQNKLNGIMYAIKKIRLREDFRSYDKMLREIKNLARLEHTNIVRYYSSWVEYVDYSGPEPSGAVDSYSQSCHDSRTSLRNAMDLESSAPLSRRTVFNEKSFNSGIAQGSMFYRPEDSSSSCSSEAMDDDPHQIQFSISDLDDSSSLTSPTRANDFSSELDIEFVDEFGGAVVPSSRNTSEVWSVESPGPKPAESQRQLTLFIQMQLCGATLKDFLEWRNAGEFSPLAIDPSANTTMFRAIVEGVKYIHHSGLIHRDLKPANIFLSLPQTAPILPKSMPATPTSSPPKSLIHPSSASLPIFGHDPDPELNAHLPFHDFDELVPKIGDFGLATSHLSPELHYDEVSSRSTSRTSRVGTITYASPEQLSNPPVAYNEKSDIYSLGIIFFELFFPFSTGMERAKVLKDLRRGVLPEDFVTKWPKEVSIVFKSINNPRLHLCFGSWRMTLNFAPQPTKSFNLS
ncbi:hypothetical protein DSO57_1012327 [Entomophthora muscae]|uniref:Uncharacterized protein n=1 Tax=Entomophthora muscae TaxID=34485 RepID=A0ACC2U4G0_9FUNG|nr:hypothetical protein DSO57_1012327 [Entomophthora muscae]